MLHVQPEGLRGSVHVDLDGVIDDQIHRDERFDDFRILFQPGHGIAHRRQINQKRDSGEILQDDPGHGEGNFLRSRLGGIPAGQIFHIAWAGFEAVTVAQDGFQDDPQGDR